MDIRRLKIINESNSYGQLHFRQGKISHRVQIIFFNPQFHKGILLEKFFKFK